MTKEADVTVYGRLLRRSVIEKLWSRVRVGQLDRRKVSTHLELAKAVSEYLKIWRCNWRQPSWLTPLEFERRQVTTVA